MTKTIRREILIPQPREQVWRALTDSAALAEWMFPNDFEPRVGHHFMFRVPPNPRMVDGLVVRCEVLECEPPSSLAFSWSAGGPVENTRVSFRLEPDRDGTRLVFEHSGFDVSVPFGEQAFKGAEFGWAKMFKQLAAVLADLAGSATDRHHVMPPPPKQLDGADVIVWTTDLRDTRPTARTTHRVGVLGPAAALAICQYDGDSQYYLFYCDDDWKVRTDTCHSSLGDAKHQAEFEYEGVSALWQPAHSLAAERT